MGVIIDTSVLMAAERGHFSMPRFAADPTVDSVAVAAITISELLQGSLRTTDPDARVRRAAFADWVASHVPVLPFGTDEARRHAELCAHLHQHGAAMGLHDLLIAGTALANGHAVATFDRRGFARVPGLRLIEVERFRSD